ncbi:MAG: UDP-N-acetylmuramoyl-L-alanine--D-glutamate ligase [Clostridiales Family XIII bacterium]|jgi:UDP-N-acetylmuramoylalanine--D-glutamate ligase|nr:UDP-N-acetylmuramoyl-L-alanine--D-glutamate ligase [Clostridiales Family XIII bacterium]
MFALMDKKILVVGLARSGAAAAKAAAALGAEVWGYDVKDASELGAAALEPFGAGRLFLGGAEPLGDEGWDLLVLSPGVPPGLPVIARAVKNGAEAIGELELAWRLSRAKFAAVTGTNGKTTTVTLLGEMFRSGGRRAEVVGNIGVPAVSKAIDEGADGELWLVVEVSSFQLESSKDFRPAVSALLNITPDHMDRHMRMEAYAAAKARIFRNQTEDDFFVVNRDDEAAWSLAAGCPARVVPFSRKIEPEARPCAFVSDGHIALKGEDGAETRLCACGELKIPGAHNLENALAAAACAFCAGIGPEAIGQALRSFGGVAHRLETVGAVGGVRFVNDSKGTNPDAAIKALEAMDGEVLLIAGGYDKGASFERFADALQGRVSHLLLMGATAGRIKAAAESAGFGRCVMCGDMERCVETAFRLASDGDTVLLSPACASWDMYSGFEERGGHFRRCVEALRG